MDRSWMDELQRGLLFRLANGPSQAKPAIQVPHNASAFPLKGLFGGESVQPDRSLRSYEDYSYGYNGTDPFLIHLAAILNNLDLGDR